MAFKSVYSKETRKPTMGISKPKQDLSKAPSGIPATPAVRPTWQRNKPPRKGFNGGKY